MHVLCEYIIQCVFVIFNFLFISRNNFFLFFENMFSKRPSNRETEDDLLRLQEEFLKKNSQQGGKVKKTQNVTSNEKTVCDGDVKKVAIDLVKLNCKIVERDVVVSPQYSMLFVNQKNSTNEKGFPVAESIFQSNISLPSKKQSLYAQKFLNKNKMTSLNEKVVDGGIVSGIGLGGHNWKNEMNRIREENQKVIESMTREELETMRAEILQKLDPKIVQFLKSKEFKFRRDIASEQNLKNDKTLSECNDSIAKPNIEDIKDKIPISLDEVKLKKYVHMDVIENDKLNWMGDIDNGKTKPSSKINFSARFNFEGELVVDSEEKETDVHLGLHHHGEEPDRPGYTINELFMYLQSSFPSQKQVGLKTFEKIIVKAYQGYYDACFNENLIEYLLKDTPLVLVVRKCLDESADTVWKSSIATLKSIVCNTVYDEIFLDRGYLIFENYLSFGYKIDLNLKPILDKEIEIDDEVPDQQYSMYDIVECLLNRTDILQRFAYLIKNHLLQYDVAFIEEMFDILIRFARHSKQSSQFILESQELMDALFSHMISTDILVKNLNLVHVKSFKLIRVCISSLMDNENETLLPSLRYLFNRFNQISFCHTLNFCLVLKPDDVPVNEAKFLLKVSIESLRLWIKLLSLHLLGCEHSFLESLQKNFYEIIPILMKILNFCKLLTPSECGSDNALLHTFDFQFASCIFILIYIFHQILDKQNVRSDLFCFELYDICMTWLTTINNLSIVPDFDTNLSILVLVEFLLKRNLVDTKFSDLVIHKLLCNNKLFNRKLFELCKKNSNTNFVKNGPSGTIRDSDNLPSFGSIYFKGFNAVPLFNNDSPICLMQGLFGITLKFSSKSTCDNLGETLQHLCEYINLFETNIHKDFKPNIFDLIEINVVSQACLVIQKAIEISDSMHNKQIAKAVLKYCLMVQVLNENQIKENLIENVLFSAQLYIDFVNQDEDFDKIKQVYRTYSKFQDNNWLFDPIVSKNDNSTIPIDQLKACLSYLEILYKNFNSHLEKIEVSNSLLFQLLASVFLINDNYFFDSDISKILQNFLLELNSDTSIECTSTETLPYFGNIHDL